ncbi:MAG: hypothetical protein JXR77_10720 [Lentisphaeria bacterium]|nr:hypothetical protein [Lentisphaeria bacterium]
MNLRPRHLALLVALLGTLPLAAEPLRVALIPPQDYEPTLSLFRRLGQELGIPPEEVPPESFVDPLAFSAARYPLAVYTGAERYCFTVSQSGDGARALLRYVEEGGVLLVAGMCWPFYRPVDWRGGAWVPSEGRLPAFAGAEDDALSRSMKAFGQTAVGNFNRFLGLNVSGQGTKQFEAPDEGIRLLLTEAGRGLFALPGEFPFPASGDLRFRPVSVSHGLAGWDLEPAMDAVGESGVAYGAASARVRHPGGGQVIYVWGTLMTTPQAEAVADGVLRLAASRQQAGGPEAARSAACRQHLAALRVRLDGMATGEGAAWRYVDRHRTRARELCTLVERVLMVNHLARAEEMLSLTADLADRIGALARAAAEVTPTRAAPGQ